MASAATLPNLYQGVEKGSFGYKMLENMGWKEGQGLGANKQGIKEHVKVKKKQDALGVGAAEHVHKLRDWTTGMVGFDAILTGLKEISRTEHASGGGGSSSADDSSSDEGHESGYASDSDTSGRVPAAKKGVKKAATSHDKKDKEGSKKRKNADCQGVGSKAKKAKKHKPNAAEAAGSKQGKKVTAAAAAAASSSSSDSSSSESDNDNAPAGTPAASLPAQVSRVRAATHLGRYQKREKAKTVRNYSATDLAAILGLPGSAPVAANAEGAAGWAAVAGVNNPNGAGAAGGSSSSSGDDSSSSDDSDGDQRNSEQRLRPSTPPGSDTPQIRPQEQQQQQQQQQQQEQGSDDETPMTNTIAAAAAEAEDAGGNSWWCSVFVRGDCGAGSVGPSGRARINVTGFQEEDQTNLYMQAHETAVKNKQGLGRAGMPKKVAGVRWQGKKTKLGSDDEEDEQQQQQQQAQEQQQEEQVAATTGRESYTRNGITVVMPIRRNEQQQQQQGTHVSQGKLKGENGGSSIGKKRRGSEVQPSGPQQSAAVPDSRKKTKKAKQQQPVQASTVAKVASSTAADAKKVKWAKLAAKILEGAPKKRMRVQKLHKKVVAAAGFDVDAPGVDSEALYQQMLKKLRKAEGLEVCEKYVAMA